MTAPMRLTWLVSPMRAWPAAWLAALVAAMLCVAVGEASARQAGLPPPPVPTERYPAAPTPLGASVVAPPPDAQPEIQPAESSEPVPARQRATAGPSAPAAAAAASGGAPALPAQAVAPPPARPGALRFQILRTRERFARLDHAVQVLADGDTIVIAPGEYGDCATFTQNNITLRAAVPGRTIFNGGICSGKAALVVAQGSLTVDGLLFRNMRSIADGNGAAIRLEEADLVVRNSIFEDSDTSILTIQRPMSKVLIERSTFRRLGRCRPDNCSHSIYIGLVGQLTIRQSRFTDGRGGHYIKARAMAVDISRNVIDDRNGRRTSFLIDLSNGASGSVHTNILIKGAHADNRCCIMSVAAEGTISEEALSIANNSVFNEQGSSVIFVANPGKVPLDLANNTLGDDIITETTLAVRGRCVLCKLMSWRFW